MKDVETKFMRSLNVTTFYEGMLIMFYAKIW